MMKSIPVWKQELSDGVHAARLASLYCCAPAETASEAARYAVVLDGLEKTFGSHAEAGLYSAPGRTEIGGNHTDHQHGRVLAGSVNIDMIAAAAPNDKNQLRVQSEGYDLCIIDLNDLEARKEEENTTASLLRGECAAFTQRGAKLAGLDIYISSNVPKGSGVSSSAAFEVLIGVILNDCFMAEKVSPIAIAQIGQWAENVYFGKPCGLMDQMASSVGNIITIDFASPAKPVVEPVAVDFSKAGLALCILDSGADHADLTDEYAAIPAVLRQARYILRSDKGLYYYCSRQGSISNTFCDKGINDLLQANLTLYRTLSDNTNLNDKDLDDAYLHLCDHQIIRIQFGGTLCIPERKIPLRRALFARRPLNYRIKAILKALSGNRYCGIVARTRKVLKR